MAILIGKKSKERGRGKKGKRGKEEEIRVNTSLENQGRCENSVEKSKNKSKIRAQTFEIPKVEFVVGKPLLS